MYGFMGSYFIQWVIYSIAIVTYVMLKLSQTDLVGFPGDTLQAGFLWVTDILLSFLVHSFAFLAQKDNLGLFSTFCVMALESAMSPRSFSSLWCRMVLRNQDLDTIVIGFLLFCDVF